MKRVGDTYKDFQVIKSVEIKEIQCLLRELIHLPTGASIMHIGNDDPENLFCLSFQTIPDSSNGVAHILEHTVLCGSLKYPIKDPFFLMTRRSLNTFMNAFTGPDFTCYPAASQIPKDFYNILEVYLDAVFHPTLDELSFLQEGHRLEFSVMDDLTSPLENKGIVFNEMKGALNSGSARLLEEMNKALYPDITYGFNSGGDPKDIPNLSYQELIGFHQTYYHPSRCLFYFYGNLPLENHLDFISEHALKGVKKVPPLPSIPKQPRFEKPKRLIIDYPIAEDEDLKDKAIIAFGFLTCHILEQKDLLALSIIELILMDNDASPLKHAFLKSKACKQATISMDVDFTEVPVLITLKGCEEVSADTLESILFSTLEEIVTKGIPLELIENAIHQLELAKSEIAGNHIPYGLCLFMRSGLLKQHGGNPENGLMIHSLFDSLRLSLKQNPEYLTDLIKKYFINNPHFVRMVMQPNKNLAKIENQEEKALLEKIEKELNIAQKKQIIEKSKELKNYQKEKESEELDDILPKIHLEDVPHFSREYPLQEENRENLKVFHHDTFTNEIVYADLTFALPAIAEKDLSLLRFYANLLPQLGCNGRNYVQNLQYLQAHTGGIGVGLSFNTQVDDYNAIFPTLSIRGKALYREADKLFPIFKDMVNKVDFSDKSRLKEVLLKHYTSLYSTLQQSPLKYAMNLSCSDLDIPSKISNKWYGLEYFLAIQELASATDEQFNDLIEKLKYLHSHTLGLKTPHLILSCSQGMYEKIKLNHFYGLNELPSKNYELWKSNLSLEKTPSQGRVIASGVAFISKALKTVPYTHEDAPYLTLLANLLDNLYLHTKIREQGGAYGGGAIMNTLSGNFNFFSYRDPNISKTLLAFKESVKMVCDEKFENSDLEEAKLEVIQNMDAPVAPGSRADLSYSRLREGKTPEIRQNFRDRLLKASKEDIIQATKKHILSKLEDSTMVIFSGKELLEKENKILKNPLPILYIK